MGMFNTETQMFLLDGVNVAAGFAVNWLLQSTLLISIGLIVGALLRSRGSAVQSLVYRTTLIAVLACPLATIALEAAGFSGWSLTMPETLAMEAPDRSIEADLKSEITPPFASQESPRESLAQLESLAPNETPIAVVELPQSFTSADSGESPIELVQPPIEAAENPEVEAEVPVTTSIFTIRTLDLLAGLAVLVWCLVALTLVFRLASAWLKLWRLKRSATKVEPELQLLCEQLAVRMEVAAPEVYRSPFLPSPCLAGLRNPSILLPEEDCGLSMQDVLIHELAHLRRHDCHWNLLRQIATGVFFFQPLLWILSRKLEVTAEEVCDDFVVQFGGDRTEYANRLVGIAHLSTAPIAAAGVGVVSLRSMLTRRVARILDTSRTLSTRVGNSILVAVFVCGIFGTGVTGLVGLRAAPPVDGATIVESQNDSDDETNVQQETSSLERNASVEQPSVEQPPTDGANSLQVTVALPDGSPADETHVALIGYSNNYTKSIILSSATTGKDGTCRLVYKGISEVAQQKATLFARRDGLAIGWKRLNLLDLAVNAPMSFNLKRQEIIKGRLVDRWETGFRGDSSSQKYRES